MDNLTKQLYSLAIGHKVLQSTMRQPRLQAFEKLFKELALMFYL
jgi:hypothetical protein